MQSKCKWHRNTPRKVAKIKQEDLLTVILHFIKLNLPPLSRRWWVTTAWFALPHLGKAMLTGLNIKTPLRITITILFPDFTRFSITEFKHIWPNLTWKIPVSPAVVKNRHVHDKKNTDSKFTAWYVKIRF